MEQLFVGQQFLLLIFAGNLGLSSLGDELFEPAGDRLFGDDLHTREKCEVTTSYSSLRESRKKRCSGHNFVDLFRSRRGGQTCRVFGAVNGRICNQTPGTFCRVASAFSEELGELSV